jgi:ABC-2 type transport system permease protein
MNSSASGFHRTSPGLISMQALAVARRVLTEYARQRRNLVFWAVFPTLMLLLFGSMYRSSKAVLDTTPAGILIGAALFFSCLGGTVSLIVGERERRTLRRLLVSPMRPVSLFLGMALALLVIAFAQALIVFLLGSLLGAKYHGSVGLGILIILLSVFSYVGLGFTFGARFAKRAEDVNGPVAAFGVPLLVLGGTFFPVRALPSTLLKIAQIDPILHMNEALKGVAGLGEGWAQLWPHLSCLLVFTAVSLGLGIQSYRRMLAEEKRS